MMSEKNLALDYSSSSVLNVLQLYCNARKNTCVLLHDLLFYGPLKVRKDEGLRHTEVERVGT